MNDLLRTQSTYIFHVKIHLFMKESDQDPDTHRSAMVWLPGPDPMRIHNIALKTYFLTERDRNSYVYYRGVFQVTYGQGDIVYAVGSSDF